MASLQTSTFTVLAGSAAAGLVCLVCRIGAVQADAAPQPAEAVAPAGLVPMLPSKPLAAAVAPLQVQFQQGQLTVKARGAPLNAVLAAITASTGVLFSVDGAAADAVSVDAGPGTVQAVIAQLLDRTNYGYAYLGNANHDNAGMPASVFLSRRGSAADAMTARARAAAPAGDATASTVAPSPARDAALQQQRAVDALFEACKAQACDTS